MASVFQLQVLSPKQANRRRARLDRLLDPELLKALSEPTRAKLLSCLLKCGRPCSVTEIAECCSVDFSMVARHLAMMARVGLLCSQKRGRTVWYAANGPALAAMFRDFADAIDELGPVEPCSKSQLHKRTSPQNEPPAKPESLEGLQHDED